MSPPLTALYPQTRSTATSPRPRTGWQGRLTKARCLIETLCSVISPNVAVGIAELTDDADDWIESALETAGGAIALAG